jgi:transcriptional regulator with XRE-family HTH domain
MNTAMKPYANTRVAKFLAKRVDELADKRSQRQLSIDAGFSTSNMLSMLKNGDAKVPLDRVYTIAKALDVDPRNLFRLTLEQFLDMSVQENRDMLSELFSTNESEIITYIRSINGSDPGLNDRRREALKEVFSE